MSIPIPTNRGGPSSGARVFNSTTHTSLSAPSPAMPIHYLPGYTTQQQSRPPLYRSGQTYSAVPVQLGSSSYTGYTPHTMSPPTNSFGHGHSSSLDSAIPPSLDIGHDTSVTTTPTSIEGEQEQYNLYATSLSSSDESYLDEKPLATFSRAPVFYHQGANIGQHYLQSTSMTPSLSQDGAAGVRTKPPRPPNAWIIYRSDKLKAFETINTREELKDLLQQADMLDQLPKYLTSIASVEKAHQLEAESNGARRKGKKPAKPAVEGRGIFRLGKGGKGLPQAEISQLISRLWKAEPVSTRSVYERKAEVAKQEHLQKYPGYKFQPVRKEEKAAMKAAKQHEKDLKKAEKELAAGNRVRRSTGPRMSRPSPISTEERRPRSQGQSIQLERAATHPGYVTGHQIHPQMVTLDSRWPPQGLPSQVTYMQPAYHNGHYSVGSAPVPLPAPTINPMATGLNRQYTPQPQALAPLDAQAYVPAPGANHLVPADHWTGAPPPDVHAMYDANGTLAMAHVAVPPPGTLQAYNFTVSADDLSADEAAEVLNVQAEAGDVDEAGFAAMWAVEVSSDNEGDSPAPQTTTEAPVVDPSLTWAELGEQNAAYSFPDLAPGQFPTPSQLVSSDWAASQGVPYVAQSGLVSLIPGGAPQLVTGATGRETTGLAAGPTLSTHQLSPLDDVFPAGSTIFRPHNQSGPLPPMAPAATMSESDLAPRYVSGSAYPTIGVDSDHLGGDWNPQHYDAQHGLQDDFVSGSEYTSEPLLSFPAPSSPSASSVAYKRQPPRTRTPGASYPTVT